MKEVFFTSSINSKSEDVLPVPRFRCKIFGFLNQTNWSCAGNN